MARTLFFSLLLLSLALSAAPAKGKPVVVIDPGHGGSDPGAVVGGVREKTVVLSFSKQLREAIKAKTGGKVFLTRTGDRALDLEVRNRFANRHVCDLFLSVHANVSENQKTSGIEIYTLNRSTDAASKRLADRENRASGRKKPAVEGIVSDLIQADATEEAAELAAAIQRSLAKKITGKTNGIRVKKALFYVLVGAKCPGLLIETGFLSNPRERKELQTPAYQKKLSEAIAEGVERFWRGHARGDL